MFTSSPLALVGCSSEGDDENDTSSTEATSIDTALLNDEEHAPSGVVAVDLGLSVKWANFNVGATSLYESGSFYAWGETETKETFTKENCLYEDSALGTSICGTPYDVAYKEWGGCWRMPTVTELRELLSKCSSIWIGSNSVKGKKFTGPNGNSIFLPAGGEYSAWNSSIERVDESGYYWSGTYSGDECLYISFNATSDSPWGDGYAWNGYKIRPVYDDSNKSASISIITGDAKVTNDDGVTLNGEVRGCKSETAVGFIYGTATEVNENNGEKKFLRSADKFTLRLRLDRGRTYYYRSFGYLKGHYIYGEVKSFSTPSKEDKVAEAVDLGLSVKWANFNIGATSPEEYGDYYAWGETEVKKNYSSETYTAKNASGNISGTQYDVASVKWGGSWRLPTQEEFKELMQKCTKSWTTMEGVKGLKLTAPNGNSIFLPAGGFSTSKQKYVGTDGDYWTGTGINGNYAKEVYLSITDKLVKYENASRSEGLSVRAVSK